MLLLYKKINSVYTTKQTASPKYVRITRYDKCTEALSIIT